MDFKVMQQDFAVPLILLDTFDEKPVDCDFVLPDYCPDIAAVLKCTLRPAVHSKQWSGDRLIVDGQTEIQVLYLDEKRNCVRSYEATQPFTSTFPVNNRCPNTQVCVSAKTDYVNCRATSPRRLDIHGSFRVKAQVIGDGVRQVLCGVDDETVFVQKQPVSCSVPAAWAEKAFTVSETLDLGGGGVTAESLIRSEATPVLTDCKILVNKLIIKGDLLLKNLYLRDEESGRMECVYHELPFSQILDVEGLTEDWQVQADVDVTANDVRITGGEEGGSRLLSVSTKLLCTVCCTRTDQAEVLTDAYAAKCPLRLETTPLRTEQLLHTYRDTMTVKQTMELPSEEIASVVDVWCDASPLSQKEENGRLVVDGQLQVCLLAKDMEDIVAYYERSADFSLDFPQEGSSTCVSFVVLRVDFSVNSSHQLELRVELLVKRECRDEQNLQIVSAVSGDENEMFPPEKASVKVVFANAGESLWGIAKSCHTSVDAVMAENNLQTDILPQATMLLVPLC